MKNKNIKSVSLLAFCSLLLLSCSKEFLDQPVNNQLAIESFYETDEQARQAVLSAYDILQWTYNPSGFGGVFFSKNFPSDETNAGGANAGDQPALVALDEFTFDATNDAIKGSWTQLYYGVNRCNLVINNINAEDSEIKNVVVAEAKALRGYYYLELVSMFGDVPLILGELEIQEYNLSRDPAASVYAQIELDLNEAIPNLPLKSELGTSDLYRITKGTAQSLLGKAYLFQEKWANASNTFAEVISSGEYSLNPDYAKVFTSEGEFGSESIFEASYLNDFGYDWGNFPWGDSRTLESNILIQLMGSREGAFSGVDSLITGWGFNYPTEKLYNAYVNAGDSIRRKSVVISQAEYEARGGTVSSNNIFGYEGYISTKYTTYSTETGGDVAPLNYGTNWRLIRYADVLLMAAEAYYRDGNEGQSIVELNKVRSRAGLSNVAVSGNELFEAIVLERQLELALEGLRYIDLIRWNKAESEIDGFTVNKHELLPIPQSEILKAPNLAPNNPGF